MLRSLSDLMRAWVYSHLMKRLLLVILLLFATASAQDVRRVVVVPFQGTEGFGSFAIGLSASLQRALNVVDGVYAPPIGDAILVAERAASVDRDPLATMRQLFGTDDLLEGRLLLQGDALVLQITLADSVRDVPLQGNLPARSAALVAGAAFEMLGLQPVAADRREVERVLAQTPSRPSLGPVALGSSGLPSGGLGGIESAVALDPESSWVRAEYARALAQAGMSEQAVTEAQRAVELASDDVEAWVVLGLVRGAAGDSAGALEAYDRALRLNPTHGVALLGVGQHAEDPVRSVASLDRAIAAYPRLSDAYLLLAARAPDLQRSLQHLRRAVPHLPDSLAIHRQIVERLIAAGESTGALTYLRDTATQPLASVPTFYALAARLPAALADEALAFVEQGRSSYPESVELVVAEGRIRLSAGDAQSVVDILAPLAEAGEDDQELINTLAIAYARVGDVDAARSLFENLGDTPAVRYNLGLLLLEAGKSREALDVFEDLVQREDAQADIVAYYGVALVQTGDVAGGRAQLERALEMAPDLRLAQRALEQLDQREQIGLAEVELTAEQSAAVDRGLFALDEGSYGVAVDAFAEARELGDAGVLAFYHGFALQRGGQSREAVAAYQDAAAAMPESSVVASNLGYAHLQRGRFDLGVEQLRRALELDPENARAHFNIGIAYYGLGRFQDAVDAWNRAEELQPGITAEVAELREDATTRVQ